MLNLKCVTILCLSLGIIEANSDTDSFLKAIKPCRYDDDDCILESARKGKLFIENGGVLGLESFNPMLIDKVEASVDNFGLTFENLVINNIPKCKITKMRRPDKLKLDAEVDCPITVTGTYSIPKGKGNILGFDIYGHGGFKIATEQIILKVLATLKIVTKDGQEYYKISGFDYSYDAKKKVYITLDNLFDGDKAKAEPFNSLLDLSWKELVDLLGAEIIKAFLKVAFGRIDDMFSQMPANKLEVQ